MSSIEFSKQIRLLTLEMVYKSSSSHIGGAFSMADIVAVLYNSVCRVFPKNPAHPERDRIYLSKGHACSSLYAGLALRGFFEPQELLNLYASDNSKYTSHASHKVPGVELSTGSLGHALPVALGGAYAAKLKNHRWHSYVILSDGEMNEGSNWEAIMLAGHLSLSNLTIIIDVNEIQSLGNTKDVIDLNPLGEKLASFGWRVFEIDGHDHVELETSLKKTTQKPKAIIAKTVKGKGVSFMENDLLWHYRSPSKEEYTLAREELL